MALKFQHILIAVLVPVAVGGAWFKFKNTTGQSTTFAPLAFVTQTPGPVGQDNVGSIEDVPSGDAPDAQAKPARRYRHQEPVFSFQYPQGFSVGSFKDEAGQTVLVQDSQSDKAGSFQVYISPLSESVVVTKARILQDVPGTVVEGAQEVQIGGVQGLAFRSKNDAGTDTREVWFAHESWLYQVSGFVGSEESISTIMRTWQFD